MMNNPDALLYDLVEQAVLDANEAAWADGNTAEHEIAGFAAELVCMRWNTAVRELRKLAWQKGPEGRAPDAFAPQWIGEGGKPFGGDIPGDALRRVLGWDPPAPKTQSRRNGQ